MQRALAREFINVLTTSLKKKFLEKHGNKKIERIGMKVGGPSNHAHSPHFLCVQLVADGFVKVRGFHIATKDSFNCTLLAFD